MAPTQPKPLEKRTSRLNSNEKSDELEVKLKMKNEGESPKSLSEKSNENTNSVSTFKENNLEIENSGITLQIPKKGEPDLPHQILPEDQKYYNGTIKFYNQKKKYGFILSQIGNKEIFFHYEDIKHTKTPRKWLKSADKEFLFQVKFQIKQYQGKKEESIKAVNIKINSVTRRNE